MISTMKYAPSHSIGEAMSCYGSAIFTLWPLASTIHVNDKKYWGLLKEKLKIQMDTHEYKDFYA